jgi:peptide/nickel transport system substrate-binding protein
MKAVVFGAIAMIIVTCTGACSSEKKSTDTLVIGLNSKPASLDPRYAKDAAGQRLLSLMFHSFVRVGPKLTVIGDAATEWSWQGNTLSLKVPKNLTFHHGRSVDQNDLKFTFEAYQSKDCPFRSSLSGLKSVTVEGSWLRVQSHFAV